MTDPEELTLDAMTRIALRQAEIDARTKVAAIVFEHMTSKTMDDAIKYCDKLWDWVIRPSSADKVE